MHSHALFFFQMLCNPSHTVWALVLMCRRASVSSAHYIHALHLHSWCPPFFRFDRLVRPIFSVNNLHTHDSVKPYVRSKGRKFEKARGRRRSNGFKVILVHSDRCVVSGNASSCSEVGVEMPCTRLWRSLCVPCSRNAPNP